MKPEQKEMLFIGGPMDGRVMKVYVLPYFRVPVMPELGVRKSVHDTIDIVSYKLCRFADGPDETYEVYVKEGIMNPMRMLLDAYGTP